MVTDQGSGIMTELDLSDYFDPAREQWRDVSLTVNGEPVRRSVPVRRLLSDFLRHDLGLRGTHVGCEHGVCGACTVLLDGASARSCLQFAVQCEGAQVVTIEGMSPGLGGLSGVQQAFADHHGLQCGFCTPGYVVAVTEFVTEFRAAHPRDPQTAAQQLSDEDVREAISGNLCRCTGYQNIVAAARSALADPAPEDRG